MQDEIESANKLIEWGVPGLLIAACSALWAFLQKQTTRIQERLFKQIDDGESARRFESEMNRKTISDLTDEIKRLRDCFESLPDKINKT